MAEAVEIINELVKRHGLGEVLGALEGICSFEAWSRWEARDRATAQRWKRAADIICDAATEIDVPEPGEEE